MDPEPDEEVDPSWERGPDADCQEFNGPDPGWSTYRTADGKVMYVHH